MCNATKLSCVFHIVVCVLDVFSRAMASGFTRGNEYLRLWTAYLDYLRRRVLWNKGNLSLPSLLIFVVDLNARIMTHCTIWIFVKVACKFVLH